MTDAHDKDPEGLDREGLAAEYALGTLSASERAQVEAMMAADLEFAAILRRWERRLVPLAAMVDPVLPPSHLWDRIKQRIADAPPIVQPAPAPFRLAEPPRGGDRRDLSRGLHRWRATAFVSTALAASLALFIATKELSPGLLPQALWPAGRSGRLVAVLQRDANAPGFLLTVDVSTKTFTLRKIETETPPDRSYELWLVSDKFPAPRSLGVIGEGEFTVSPTLAGYDRGTIHSATYAVSLEPRGGSPTGAPTGPVVFTGKLIAAER